MRIAICDDEKEVLEFTRAEVERIGHKLHCEMEIFEYSDGMELLEDVSSERNIEVVLLDIDMPNISGMHIANKLVEEQPFINIVFLTNHADMVFQTM